MDPAELEGLAISKSNGYRTKRPKRRPKKSRGHGPQPEWSETLRNKKKPKPPETPARPIAVPPVPMSDSLIAILKARTEYRHNLTPEEYAALKRTNNG